MAQPHSANPTDPGPPLDPLKFYHTTPIQYTVLLGTRLNWNPVSSVYMYFGVKNIR